MEVLDNNEDEFIYQEWFIKKGLTSGSQKIYRVSLENFKEYTGKTLSELVDIAESEEESGTRMRKRSVNRYVIGFKNYLEEKNLAPGTVNNKMAAVISFYQSFDIQIPTIKMPVGDICLEKNYHQPPKKREIQAMISVANARDAAIIYTMALTGMAAKEIRNLTVGKYVEIAGNAIEHVFRTVDDLFDHEDEVLQEILMLELTRKKINYRHQTFIPPESSRAIIAYLKSRNNDRNEKRHIKSLNDPLFITKTGGKLGSTSIGNNIRRLGHIAGLKPPAEEGTYRYWRPHSLRKYFISTIINTTGDHILADYLAGHKISDVKRAYWYADPKDLKRKYLKALPYLSIDGAKVKDFESEEFKQYVEDSKKKDEKIDVLERKLKIVEGFIVDQKTRNEFDKLEK